MYRLVAALRYRYDFVRVVRKPKIPIDQALVDYFPATLMQNIDNMCLVQNRKDKVITRMGGMVIDTNSKPTRYDAQLAQCGAVIATNKQLYDISARVNCNTFFVPNPVDLRLFRPKPILWPDHGERFTIGFAGNIWGSGAEYKGWKYYVETALKLFNEVDKKECLHNGPSNQRQIGHDRMCEDFYWKIDCLILPSVNEGCSNVTAEALACGVPVLTTKVGYHGDELEDGVNAIFIERDSADIIEKVLMLKNDASLYKRLSVNGRIFAEENHNLEKIAFEYDRILKGMLNKNR